MLNLNSEVKEASDYTIDKNKKIAEELGLDIDNNFTDELEIAADKLILSADGLKIKKLNSDELAWDVDNYSFFKSKATPYTINPSLWINGKGNSYAGVFEVIKDKIYQVRGLDIANLTIIRGKSGWIVQDVMTNVEVSSKAIDLLEEALKENIRDNIKAIIISHSHSDHYGGIKGVVKEEQVGHDVETQVQIYVPVGFDAECVKETLFAGTAMGRRAEYQFGGAVKPGIKGKVSVGIGVDISNGTGSFITPTNYISENGIVEIDGLKVDFQLTPGTEAPAEMNNYFVDYKAFWVAENCTGTLHNLYPIRGAQLRDSSAWASFILEAMDKYADKSDVIFQSHNWPHFNTKEHPDTIRNYLLNNASLYKYIHDQTLLYANEGFTAKEIAKKIRIPENIKKDYYLRPYYGSLPINARAVYTKYLGFFNGNPNEIDPLTEVEEAKTFVEYVGSEEEVLTKASKDYEAGEYNRAAYAAGKVVLANPKNQQARFLTADAFEQLGYVSESSVWRNAYLQGAFELRAGVRTPGDRKAESGSDLAKCMSAELLLKYIGILYDSDKSKAKDFELRLKIHENTYGNESENNFVLKLYGGVVLSYPYDEKVDDKSSIEAYAELNKEALFALLNKKLSLVKDKIKTNKFEYLERLEEGLIDVKEHSRFKLVESNETV
ncbi:MAG: MBL fold metallo-hydrolase [Lachnospiraceae bacterium]|nr:MBL fold metallo-hydrolase [Lachnospiraceae bacterium]